MFRNTLPLSKIMLASALFFSVLLVSSPISAFAHFEPQKEPMIFLELELNSVYFPPERWIETYPFWESNFDDGWNDKGDMVLFYEIDYTPNHEEKIIPQIAIFNFDHNRGAKQPIHFERIIKDEQVTIIPYDEKNRQEKLEIKLKYSYVENNRYYIDKTIYTHKQCDPPEEIKFKRISLQESDENDVDKVTSDLDRWFAIRGGLVMIGATISGGWVVPTAVILNVILAELSSPDNKDFGTERDYTLDEGIENSIRLAGYDGLSMVYYSLKITKIPDWSEGLLNPCNADWKDDWRTVIEDLYEKSLIIVERWKDSIYLPNESSNLIIPADETKQSSESTNEENKELKFVKSEYTPRIIYTQDVNRFFDSINNVREKLPELTRDDVADESNFDQFKSKSEQKLAGHVDWIFVSTFEHSPYDNTEKAFNVREEAKALIEEGNIDAGFEKYREAFMMFAQSATIPAWIKNNAEWWAAGQISDKDFATGIEYMIKNEIIPGYQVASTTTTGISDDVKIPGWIKNNARWWAQGEITEDDFLKGVDFMVDEKIINIGKGIAKTERSDAKAITIEPNDDILKNVYKAQVLNENAMELLLQAKSFEDEFLDKQIDALWSEFSNTQDQTLMNEARDYEILQTNIQREVSEAVNAYNAAKQLAEYTKDKVVQKVNPAEIENMVIDTYSQDKIPSLSEYRNTVKEAKKISDIVESLTEETVEKIADQIELEHGISINVEEINFESLVTKQDTRTFTIVAPIETKSNVKLPEISDQLFDPSIIKGHMMIEHLGQEEFEEVFLDANTSSFEESEKTTDETIGQEQNTDFVTIKALDYGDKQFPVSQFTTWKWNGECDNLWHYHPAGEYAMTINLNSIPDPDPNNCGFGPVQNIPLIDVQITQEQADAFQEVTGFDPLENEAQVGGEGP